MAKKKRKGNKKRKSKKRTIKEWSEADKNFLITNYLTMTDAQIAKTIGRTSRAVSRMRDRLQLLKTKEGRPEKVDVEDRFRSSHVASLSDTDKKEFLLKELRRTSQYKRTKDVLLKQEKDFYEERYIEFMLDPTVETMTSAEKDTLHRKTLTEIRLLRFMKDEKEAREAMEEEPDPDDEEAVQEHRRKIKYLVNRSKEIDECQKVIKECEKSLNVTREQRLKNSSDQAINFTSIVKDLQNVTVRKAAGDEAATFRWMSRRHYNDRLGSNILSGRNEKYDLDQEFKDGKEPDGLHSDFIPEMEIDIGDE